MLLSCMLLDHQAVQPSDWKLVGCLVHFLSKSECVQGMWTVDLDGKSFLSKRPVQLQVANNHVTAMSCKISLILCGYALISHKAVTLLSLSTRKTRSYTLSCQHLWTWINVSTVPFLCVVSSVVAKCSQRVPVSILGKKPKYFNCGGIWPLTDTCRSTDWTCASTYQGEDRRRKMRQRWFQWGWWTEPRSQQGWNQWQQQQWLPYLAPPQQYGQYGQQNQPQLLWKTSIVWDTTTSTATGKHYWSLHFHLFTQITLMKMTSSKMNWSRHNLQLNILL